MLANRDALELHLLVDEANSNQTEIRGAASNIANQNQLTVSNLDLSRGRTAWALSRPARRGRHIQHVLMRGDPGVESRQRFFE
jgi:hypothetical protein